jgi:diacylglycerol O-acyltransferase
MYNLLITNVPGPQIPLYAAGVPVVAMYPVAQLAKGQALALSVTSYNGQVFFGLTADREAIPDLHDFGALLHEALDEFPRTGSRSNRAAARQAAADEQAGEPVPPPVPDSGPNPAAKLGTSVPTKPRTRATAKAAAAPTPTDESVPARRRPPATGGTPSRARARPVPKPTPPRPARPTPTGSEAAE